MSAVMVPVVGVEAKLSRARKPLAAHNKNAASVRGQVRPDNRMGILFMMFYESEITGERLYPTT
jgi:hypothetical protein